MSREVLYKPIEIGDLIAYAGDRGSINFAIVHYFLEPNTMKKVNASVMPPLMEKPYDLKCVTVTDRSSWNSTTHRYETLRNVSSVLTLRRSSVMVVDIEELLGSRMSEEIKEKFYRIFTQIKSGTYK